MTPADTLHRAATRVRENPGAVTVDPKVGLLMAAWLEQHAEEAAA